MLDLNITILFQLFNFLFSIFVLNILLVRPIRRILAERQSKMDDIQSKTDSFNSDAEGRMANYQAALQSARQDATKIREDVKIDSLSEQQGIVQSASQKAQTILVETQEVIKAEAKIASMELQKQVSVLSTQIVTKLLN